MAGALKRRAAVSPGFAKGLADRREHSEGDGVIERIPADMTLRQYCESLAVDRIDPRTGKLHKALLVDGKPFSLADRPTLAWVYDQLPSTREEAAGRTIVVMKCAQVGFTVMEMMFGIYGAQKFEPLAVGFFMPDKALANGKSAERFMPIVRSIPEAYEALTAADPGALSPKRTEGNVMRRRMGKSLLHFLWTSGRATTESYAMDLVCFDEVQEMSPSDIERVSERMSGSKFKFTLMGSTANHPDSDIDHFYRTGSQWRFHTQCPECGAEEPLDAYFPACIGFDADWVHPVNGSVGEYRYRCRAGHWIDDTQVGAWKADNPDAESRHKSIHFHQMLSPTISAREMYESYLNASDIKNFYNRKLGKPYQDPNELPVNAAHLAACVAEGERMGVTWKTTGTNTFMGIDQMTMFNCVVIKERRVDGRHAVIHMEEIYADNPFERCTELMAQFGVQVCVVEELPNSNAAHNFATEEAHLGRVFVCNSYGNVEEGVARWGDSPSLTASQRRTDPAARARYTVRIDQYKAMSSTLRRIAAHGCLFPDPMGLTQEVREKDSWFHAPILKDRVFPHLISTALVTERVNERERRYRRKVEKRGKDPHHSFAMMLCDVAMIRAHGTATFLLPDLTPPAPTSPEHHPIVQQLIHHRREGTCGACKSFRLKDGEPGAVGAGICQYHTSKGEMGVRDRDPCCHAYVPAKATE